MILHGLKHKRKISLGNFNSKEKDHIGFFNRKGRKERKGIM